MSYVPGYAVASVVSPVLVVLQAERGLPRHHTGQQIVPLGVRVSDVLARSV